MIRKIIQSNFKIIENRITLREWTRGVVNKDILLKFPDKKGKKKALKIIWLHGPNTREDMVI